MADEDRRKHLEMIQGVVNRLAGNSFSVKGWSVGLISVLGGFAAKDADLRFSSVLLFPALVFWGLDAYYLRRERLFRKLYEKAVAYDPAATLYLMDPSAFDAEVDSWVKVAFSITVRWLHIPIVVFVVILMLYAASKRL